MKTQISNSIRRSQPYLMAVFALLLSISAGLPENEFKILKSRNGIDLYYRWMEMPDGNRVRQMKAVLTVNSQIDEVVTLLKDENRAVHWIAGAESFRHLEVISQEEWISYIKFSVPWPLADQDCILEFTSQERADGEITVQFNCNPEFIQEKDGINRMKDINGCFVLRPSNEGFCLLECYFLSEKRSVIPRWITEPIITGNIFNMMESLRNELAIV